MLSRRLIKPLKQMRGITQTKMCNPSLFTIQNFHFSTESNFDGHNDFESKSKMAGGSSEMEKQITEWVESNDVCVFMKGNRKMPRCGFSNYVVQIFKFYNVKQYKDVNVLDDDVLREQIKEFSNWPTIPQVYIKGQFVGGCDIMKEMHADGSLEELLIREGIIKGELEE